MQPPGCILYYRTWQKRATIQLHFHTHYYSECRPLRHSAPSTPRRGKAFAPRLAPEPPDCWANASPSTSASAPAPHTSSSRRRALQCDRVPPQPIRAYQHHPPHFHCIGSLQIALRCPVDVGAPLAAPSAVAPPLPRGSWLQHGRYALINPAQLPPAPLLTLQCRRAPGLTTDPAARARKSGLHRRPAPRSACRRRS